MIGSENTNLITTISEFAYSGFLIVIFAMIIKTQQKTELVDTNSVSCSFLLRNKRSEEGEAGIEEGFIAFAVVSVFL